MAQDIKEDLIIVNVFSVCFFIFAIFKMARHADCIKWSIELSLAKYWSETTLLWPQ